MNRGVLQTSPPLQMAGNPNWWNINNMKPPTHQQTSPFLNPPSFFPQYYIPSSSASSPSSSSSASSSSSSSSCSSSSTSSSLALPSWHDNQDQLPESWSQLLMGGLVDEGDKGNMRHFQAKKTENWEEQILHHQASTTCTVVGVKRENSATSYVYGHANEDFQAAKPSWSQMIPPASSSPMSSVTNFSSNMLDFSTHKGDARHPPSDLSSECNSTATGGALKKARVQQPSSTQSTFKVRKEKLGDRITSLHQLVSPFGKTDTASVLLEAIGYIRFLQSQIEALSSPYLGSGSSNMKQQQQQQLQSVQGERNCTFPEEPGQNYNEEPKKDLRSRGLCLVPVSCTLQVGSDNGADYWAPAIGGGFQ